jgi:hypothetical protein
MANAAMAFDRKKFRRACGAADRTHLPSAISSPASRRCHPPVEKSQAG